MKEAMVCHPNRKPWRLSLDVLAAGGNVMTPRLVRPGWDSRRPVWHCRVWLDANLPRATTLPQHRFSWACTTGYAGRAMGRPLVRESDDGFGFGLKAKLTRLVINR